MLQVSSDLIQNVAQDDAAPRCSSQMQRFEQESLCGLFRLVRGQQQVSRPLMKSLGKMPSLRAYGLSSYTPLHSLPAFTLIELLVVISIIAILAALALSGVSAMRKQADTAKDLSNLRQIGGAIQLHVADNNGLLPNPELPIAGTRLSGGEGDRWTFHEAVERYLGDGWRRNPASIYNYLGNPIWRSSYAAPYANFNPLPEYNKTRPIAYGFNAYVTNSRWAGRTVVIPNLSRYVIMAEVNDQSSVSMTRPPESRDNVQTGYRVNRSGKSLYLFCDGRVDLLPGNNSEAALVAGQQTNIWRWW